jgi:hypothetical protein
VKLFDIFLTMHGLMSFDEEKKNSFGMRNRVAFRNDPLSVNSG